MSYKLSENIPGSIRLDPEYSHEMINALSRITKKTEMPGIGNMRKKNSCYREGSAGISSS